MVTLFSLLHLRFTIVNPKLEGLVISDRSALASLSNIYLSFHVGVVDNILWLRKFWKKY